MKNFKKMLGSFLAVALALAVSAPVFAGIPDKREVPYGPSGPIEHPLYGGADFTRQSSTDELVVCIGRCLLIALIRSTGSVDTSIQIRNTGIPGSSGDISVANLHFERNTGAHANPIPFPMVHTNGISINLSSTAESEDVTVLYIDLD